MFAHPIMIALSATTLLAAFCVAPVKALDPTPQVKNEPGVIRETSDQIREPRNALAAGDLDIGLPRLIDVWESDTPVVRSAELANYLITAYCPKVSSMTELSEAEKEAKMKSFADRVSQSLF